ncbi:Pre-mRNA-splicing regulator WTAP [Holothuria leucospilota]|uniref:Pre-mRNA-splicing regulator WTAP n=1 Tax=Holothuria leucospilota TaxID=206669 RepID=A0A9Q0YS97_HOLLE|nr:Pre-mRNA-splicing regulator WTAP [Holothuria leucospilota]
MTEEQPPLKRIRLSDDVLEHMRKEEFIQTWRQQEEYVEYLEARTLQPVDDDFEEKLRQLQSDFTRKEKIQKLRLSTKEQEFQELANKLAEISKGQSPGANQLRSSLLDPALNLLFQRMKKELEDKNNQLQQAQEDMTAWKFTSDSQTGKRLMARCRTLLQENQDLGKQVSSGKIANLEAELAVQKKYNEELKGSQDELYEMVVQLNEEGEGMQSTICALQQQLKEANTRLAKYEANPSSLTNSTETNNTELAMEQSVTVHEDIQDDVIERTDDLEKSEMPENVEMSKHSRNSRTEEELGADDENSMVSANEDSENEFDDASKGLPDAEGEEEVGMDEASDEPLLQGKDQLSDSIDQESRTTEEHSEQYATSQVPLEASPARTSGQEENAHIHGENKVPDHARTPSTEMVLDKVDADEKAETTYPGKPEMRETNSYADVRSPNEDVSLESEMDIKNYQSDHASLDYRTTNDMSPDSPPNELVEISAETALQADLKTSPLPDNEKKEENRTSEDEEGKGELIGKDAQCVDRDNKLGDDGRDHEKDNLVSGYEMGKINDDDDDGCPGKEESHCVDNNGDPQIPVRENNGEVITPQSPQNQCDSSTGQICDEVSISRKDSDSAESNCSSQNDRTSNSGEPQVKTTNGLEDNILSKDSGLPNHSPDKETKTTLKAQGSERTNGPGEEGQSPNRDSSKSADDEVVTA